MPAEPLDAKRSTADPGQQRIDEVSQHRDRHGDQINRLEQAINDCRKQHPEHERVSAHARRRRLRSRPVTQIEIENDDADHAADQRQRQYVDAGGKDQFYDGVADAERSGGNDARDQSGNPLARAIGFHSGSAVNERAGAELGEQFEQHRMRHLAVQDNHTFDALFERVDAGFDLRDHAAGNGAVGNQPPRIVDRKLLDQRLRFIEHAGNVGEQQKTFGVQRTGNGAGKRVGIDVERAAVGCRSDRRQNRNQLTAEDLIEHRSVDLLRLADKTEINNFLDMRVRIDHGARQLARDDHVAVLAAEADRLAAGFVDVGDHLLVDQAGQHHFDDFERRGIGNAKPGGILRLHADPLEHRFDLRAAAVHDHRVDGGLLQEHDILGEFARQMFFAHGVAAVFDDNNFLVIALHVGQRFRQDAGLYFRADGVLAHWLDIPGKMHRLSSGAQARRQLTRAGLGRYKSMPGGSYGRSFAVPWHARARRRSAQRQTPA